MVQQGKYNQVFHAPTEAVTALISSPGAGDLIGARTVERANVGLFWMGIFNQLVALQTAFHAQFLPDIADAELPASRRDAIASAAESISRILHGRGIGGAGAAGGWYHDLKRAVDENVGALDEAAQQRSRGATLAWALLIAAGLFALWQLH
jgi:hypothetical protein